jgi:hypothetical protein
MRIIPGPRGQLAKHLDYAFRPWTESRPIVDERNRLTVTQAERFGRVNFHSNVISTGL